MCVCGVVVVIRVKQRGMNDPVVGLNVIYSYSGGAVVF